jgi:L-alanine-DL-glutamate epimerase-like enolase superfamily enzyme
LGQRPWEVLSDLDEKAPISVQLDHILGQIDVRLPSARFAVETAILDLVAQRQERPLWTLLTESDSAKPVPLAATLMAAEARDVLPAARAAHARGIDTLKLKVGRPGRFSEELDMIRVLKRELEVTIRVDANRSFPTGKLPKMLEQLAKAGVSLCEEPSTFDAVIRLRESPVPLAFDESLTGPEGDTRLSSLGDRGLLGAVVLKPTTLGGLFRCRELARRARAATAPAIMSHTLDGPIAFMASAALAVALPEPRLAAGMDKHPGLGTWPDVDLPALGNRSLEPVNDVGLGLPRIVDWA